MEFGNKVRIAILGIQRLIVSITIYSKTFATQLMDSNEAGSVLKTAIVLPTDAETIIWQGRKNANTT